MKLRAFGAECRGKLLGVNAAHQGFFAEVVALLSGEMPAPGEKCINCEYFDKRKGMGI